MSTALAAILGAAAGVMALVILLIVCVRVSLSRTKRASRTSESNSSNPSSEAGQNVELLAGTSSYASTLNGVRCFKLEELIVATKDFSQTHLIGSGQFGEVFKGLLPDMIVAIKRRRAPPSHELVVGVQYLSSIHHRNLVSLVGYCQENDVQMVVFEYIPNGSVSSHLYGSNQKSSEKLEFKHRLSIAYGTAKGLAYLHSLNPVMLHRDVKTANVLVDDNFTPKVSDVGLRSLLDKIDGTGHSLPMTDNDLFRDPDVQESEKSDVFGFGVFLLELVSGRPVAQQFSLSTNIIQWAQNYRNTSDISSLIDRRMRTTFTTKGMREFFQLAVWCLNPSQAMRPPMSFLVSELERIQEKEMSLTTVMGEGTPTVTLGSQLFTSWR